MTASTTKLKRLARDRQRQTGERYTDALAAVRLPKEAYVSKSKSTVCAMIPFYDDRSSHVPVVSLSSGDEPAPEVVLLRTNPLSGPCTLRGLLLSCVAGETVQRHLLLRRLRVVGSDRDLLEENFSSVRREDGWFDGRRFSANPVLDNGPGRLDVPLGEGQQLEVEVRLSRGHELFFFAAECVVDCGASTGQDAWMSCGGLFSWKTEFIPLSSDGTTSVVATVGGEGALGERVEAKILPSMRPSYKLKRLVGLFFQSEHPTATGVVLAVENLRVMRGGRPRTTSLLIDDGCSLADDYSRLPVFIEKGRSVLRASLEGDRSAIRECPLIGPGDDVSLDIRAFSPNGEEGRGRFSLIVQTDGAFSQDLAEAWAKEIDAFDRNATSG